MIMQHSMRSIGCFFVFYFLFQVRLLILCRSKIRSRWKYNIQIQEPQLSVKISLQQVWTSSSNLSKTNQSILLSLQLPYTGSTNPHSSLLKIKYTHLFPDRVSRFRPWTRPLSTYKTALLSQWWPSPVKNNSSLQSKETSQHSNSKFQSPSSIHLYWSFPVRFATPFWSAGHNDRNHFIPFFLSN